jgi:hypothetical protein
VGVVAETTTAVLEPEAVEPGAVELVGAPVVDVGVVVADVEGATVEAAPPPWPPPPEQATRPATARIGISRTTAREPFMDGLPLIRANAQEGPR